jgi:hypothetical protein
VIPQSLLLCSASVGMSPFVTKSLSFLREGLGFDATDVGGDKEPSCGRGLRWNHRRQLHPLERKELNGRIWRLGSTNNNDLRDSKQTLRIV